VCSGALDVSEASERLRRDGDERPHAARQHAERAASLERAKNGPEEHERAITSRRRDGYGSTANSSERNSRSPNGRSKWRARICARVRSMSGPYCTPRDRIVTQPNAGRDTRSKWLTKVGVIAAAPLERRFHQVDAAARRVHLLVPEQIGGTRGKAKPQWTQASMSAIEAGRCR